MPQEPAASSPQVPGVAPELAGVGGVAFAYDRLSPLRVDAAGILTGYCDAPDQVQSVQSIAVRGGRLLRVSPTPSRTKASSACRPMPTAR